MELGLVIGKGGRDISQDAAESHIAGYGAQDSETRTHGALTAHFLALAVDMTARNMQDEVKKKGLPWSAVKGFDTFTPIGSASPSAHHTPSFVLTLPYSRKFIPKSSISNPHDLRLALKVLDLLWVEQLTCNVYYFLTDQWHSQAGWHHRRHDFPHSETRGAHFFHYGVGGLFIAVLRRPVFFTDYI